MAAEVIPLRREKDEPTMAGGAMCLQCRHKWAAVAPAGTEWLECPACGMHKGAFTYPCCPPDGADWWQCNCGGHLFYMTRNETVCYKCGASQNLA